MSTKFQSPTLVEKVAAKLILTGASLNFNKFTKFNMCKIKARYQILDIPKLQWTKFKVMIRKRLLDF